MPIWLRKFTFSKIQDFYSKESEAAKNAGKGKGNTLIDSSGNVNKGEFKKLGGPFGPPKK